MRHWSSLNLTFYTLLCGSLQSVQRKSYPCYFPPQVAEHNSRTAVKCWKELPLGLQIGARWRLRRSSRKPWLLLPTGGTGTVYTWTKLHIMLGGTWLVMVSPVEATRIVNVLMLYGELPLETRNTARSVNATLYSTHLMERSLSSLVLVTIS